MGQLTAGQLQEVISGSGMQAHNRVTFAGANSGDPGAVGSTTLFTVTGLVAVKLVGVCEVDLAGSATIEIGTTINTAGIIAQVADATNLDANEIWHDATPDASVELVSGAASFAEKLVSQDIKVKVGSAAITAGRILFIAIWRPISDGATLTPAYPGGSASPSLSPSASRSPSSSTSPSASLSPSASASISPSASLSPSASASRSDSPSPSLSQSPSASLSPSSSTSPSASRSPSSSVSPSPSPSA